LLIVNCQLFIAHAILAPMEDHTPRKFAIVAALLLAGVFSLVLVLVDHLMFSSSVSSLMLVARSAGLFVLLALAVYLSIMYIINDFIYEKIRVIYKTMNSQRPTKENLKKDIRENNGVIDRVNRDVITWADKQRDEIQSLKDQEEFRREFIGNVSHELKTPIFNIQGYIHTLLDGGLEDDEINRKFLQRADKSVERMISVVNDLETISKLESSQIELNVVKLNILDLAKEIIELQEMKATKRDIELRFNKKYDKPILVMADADRIKQVYINLIDNSIKYGSSGGFIELRFYDMDEHILCEVSDDGSGIEEKHIPRLFERFYRVDKARDRNAGGTGLGLSIVKHIIEAHGESISVRSSTGDDSGTTFSFTLKKTK